VELFAGTYRTALSLSRTFILPDSPRSLELQLQGDDLVEVFLVFAQNVFGLEPATVRVREVRIGRAERRAARRRARENQGGDPLTNDPDNQEEETNINVSIGVTVPVASSAAHDSERSSSPTLVENNHPDSQADVSQIPTDPASSSPAAQAEELVLLATAQMGPYTTFQQLAFVPNFPLASIADDYIIPPTYPSFLEYRGTYEPQNGDQTDLPLTQFSPPGLPVPTPTVPSKWFYRDPKNVVHGKYFNILSKSLTNPLLQDLGKRLSCKHGTRMVYSRPIFPLDVKRTPSTCFSRNFVYKALIPPNLSERFRRQSIFHSCRNIIYQ
jgi:hypothetical protein